MRFPFLIAVVVFTAALTACGRTLTKGAITPQDAGHSTVVYQTPNGPVKYSVHNGVITGNMFGVHPEEVMDATAGADSGTPFQVFLPEASAWNGRLAIYTHGYTDPIDYPVNSGFDQAIGTIAQPYPDQTNPDVSAVHEALYNNGFAFAWSSYKKPGYAVQSGVSSTGKLIDIAKNMILATYSRAPSATYVLGHSLGGVIGAALAENTTYGPKIKGVLAMCGPVNGMTQQVKYTGDLRTLYDYYFQANYKDKLAIQIPTTDFSKPLTSPASDEQLRSLGWAILTAPDSNRAGQDYYHNDAINSAYHYYGIAAAAARAVFANLTKATSLATIDQLKLPYSNNDELVHSIVDALFYPVRGAADSLQTAGGNPFDNRLTSYTRAGRADKSVNGTTGVIRYTPSTDAQGYVKSNYDTTGALRAYVLTLHTNQDPQVPFSHEANYATKVGAKGKKRYLAQQYSRHYGHCAMTETETANALNALVTWAETGGWVRPRTGDVTTP